VSLEFLSPAPTAVARSPMEREALAAGAVIEQRDGWNVAVRFEGEEGRLATVGFADRSQVGKLELHGQHGLPLGEAVQRDEGW
jgi:glycine cleavage system aminomethyltransferase T